MTGDDRRITPDDRFGEWVERAVDRRRLLAALGTAAVPAIAGCSGATDTTTEPGGGMATQATTEAMQETTMQQTTRHETTQQTDGESIHPRFGFTGTDDESPPVEPDHTVALEIRPREAPIPEFYFEPTGLAIEPGETVRFNLATPHHNVNAWHPAFGYTQRVPDGVPPYSSPVLTPGDYWLYTFETEGVHNIVCAPHEVFGMVGNIVVGSATGPGANPPGEAPAPREESRPPEFTAELVLNDPAMAPENIVEQGSVSWDDIAEENKRLMIAPVEE